LRLCLTAGYAYGTLRERQRGSFNRPRQQINYLPERAPRIYDDVETLHVTSLHHLTTSQNNNTKFVLEKSNIYSSTRKGVSNVLPYSKPTKYKALQFHPVLNHNVFEIFAQQHL
jgi:hypothetical protein